MYLTDVKKRPSFMKRDLYMYGEREVYPYERERVEM